MIERPGLHSIQNLDWNIMPSHASRVNDYNTKPIIYNDLILKCIVGVNNMNGTLHIQLTGINSVNKKNYIVIDQYLQDWHIENKIKTNAFHEVIILEKNIKCIFFLLI